MSSEQQTNHEPAGLDAGNQLSFMDKQFKNMSGCGQWFSVLFFPCIGFIAGLIGLFTCKDATARSRAGSMAIVGGIWFVISMLIFIWMINWVGR